MISTDRVRLILFLEGESYMTASMSFTLFRPATTFSVAV